MTRPLIALPCRFAERTSALRYAAEVTARALAEAVYRAGGEPFMMHPAEPEHAAERLERCDGLLLPGGGDLAPHTYGEADVHEQVYDVDDAQDAFDLAAIRYALRSGLPTLAVCRGMQVLNVALGGTLTQDMPTHHRHVVHPVRLREGSAVAAAMGTGGQGAAGREAAWRDAATGAEMSDADRPGADRTRADRTRADRLGAYRSGAYRSGAYRSGAYRLSAYRLSAEKVEASCYHHQSLDRLGRGLTVTARAADGTVEAVELRESKGLLLAVQWHPEDTAATDEAQHGLFTTLAEAASRHHA
ncbi:gamma-glutamyl-gamma-aminobutyrate hydrolase family protein [Streptomycetaceae bacterium NBC_01309]